MNETEKENYKKKIKNIIQTILKKENKEVLTFDILDTTDEKLKKIILKDKRTKMKIGEIWEHVIGNYNTFEKLKNHSSGLDIMSKTRKIIIELKNRTNTDNASSRKTNLDKLATFKKSHKDWTCIYGNINDSTQEKTLKGRNIKIVHNEVEILHCVGMEFLNLIFGKDIEWIIKFIKDILENDNENIKQKSFVNNHIYINIQKKPETKQRKLSSNISISSSSSSSRKSKILEPPENLDEKESELFRDLSKNTNEQLKQFCRTEKISPFSGLNKANLILKIIEKRKLALT